MTPNCLAAKWKVQSVTQLFLLWVSPNRCDCSETGFRLFGCCQGDAIIVGSLPPKQILVTLPQLPSLGKLRPEVLCHLISTTVALKRQISDHVKGYNVHLSFLLLEARVATPQHHGCKKAALNITKVIHYHGNLKLTFPKHTTADRQFYIHL